LHVIDDPALPMNCIDEQGRVALSVNTHSTWTRSCGLVRHGKISSKQCLLVLVTP
jgi:hypothetical protein